MPHVLDNPAWHALTGRQADLGVGDDLARRFRPEVSPMLAVRNAQDPRTWPAIRAIAGSHQVVALTTVDPDGPLPADWQVSLRIPGVQLLSTDRVVDRPDPEALVLGDDDVPEMVELARMTEPGPFETHTRLMVTYLGLRHEGRLVAMAGERFKPAGHTEISAVCTHPDHRGQGLATRLVLAVAHGIRRRGEVPFLHTSAANVGAIALYEHLGFVLRRRVDFVVLRPAT